MNKYGYSAIQNKYLLGSGHGSPSGHEINFNFNKLVGIILVIATSAIAHLKTYLATHILFPPKTISMLTPTGHGILK